MLAEIISIGDELTSGQRLDTNSQWLSQRLAELGVHVAYHTTVADELAAGEAVFRHAAGRAELIVATGGLGPTDDDLTRESLAAAAGVELVLHEPSLAHIQSLFARHRRDMPERNRRQAALPAGSQPIPNPSGTAPGIDMQLRGASGRLCQVFALPGVPAEMREMFQASVAPAVEALLPTPRVIRHRRIKCFGAGESHLEQMLPDLIRRGRQPSVGITVHEATITLRITADGGSEQECLAAMNPTVDTIHECLGDLVFGEEDDELQDAVVRLLIDRRKTLATVEWGSEGYLAHWLAAADPSRVAFLGGVVAGTRHGMQGAGLSQFDPSNREAVGTLAGACRRQFGADYSLAVGKFPNSATAEQPEPYFIALATAANDETHGSTLISHASIWKPRAAKQALNLLRLRLVREA